MLAETRLSVAGSRALRRPHPGPLVLAFRGLSTCEVTGVAVRSATKARSRSPTAIEFHAGAEIESTLEGRLRKADPAHKTVEESTGFHGAPSRSAQPVPCPRGRQRSPSLQTGKPAQRPPLRRGPVPLAEFLLLAGNRQFPVRSRRNAGKMRKPRRGIASGPLSPGV